ncbi:MAG: hypothetical protein IJF97_00615 [Eggerthellaceae bacterium]|nr:hypothetical protein [Eggerthellaceae bacterium]MBQ3342707.1 antitoxin [Kiritimatiellia bacterium]
MASTTMGVRLSSDERMWLDEYATFTGKTASELMREAVLEMIEDAVDVYEYNRAMSETDEEEYSMDDVMRSVMEAQ